MFGKKLISAFALTMMMLSLFAGFALAADVPVVDLGIDNVEINGHVIGDNERIEVRRGETLDLDVKVVAPEEIEGQDNYVENVQMQALLVYKYSDHDDSVQDMTRTFDLQYGSTAVKDLSVQVPIRMDAEDDMLLQLTVYADNMNAYTQTYRLDIRGVDHEDAVLITESYLSREVLEAGQGSRVTVKVRNYGDEDLDDVTLIASVPALGIKEVETLDEVEADEKETFESLVLRIPSDAKPGVYDVNFAIKFDEYEMTSEKATLTVIAPQASEEEQSSSKTVITVPNAQSVTAGTAGAAFPVVIANMGDEAKAYQLTVQGVENWGTARVDPAATVIVGAGETVTAFLYVTANDNVQAGQKVFQLTVNDGSEQEQIALTANVAQGTANDWSGLKKTLEVGLVVLVIILIIIGLIVGFNKLKGNDEDDEDKTYY